MTETKMKTGQGVSGGFDLDAFVNGGTDTTPRHVKPKAVEQNDQSPARMSVVLPALTPAQPLKAPRPREFTERAQIRLTPVELDTIRTKAAGVPLSVFLRKFLYEKGML